MERDELREINTETGQLFRFGLKWGLIGLVVLIPIGFGLQSLGIITLGIQREVIQHSQPYVETKVNLLNKLHSDYMQLAAEIIELNLEDATGYRELVVAKTAQQKNVLSRLRTEAGMIPRGQVPVGVLSLLSTGR